MKIKMSRHSPLAVISSCYIISVFLIVLPSILLSVSFGQTLSDNTNYRDNDDIPLDNNYTSFEYLLGEFDERLNLQNYTDLKLINILNRDGPDLRTSTDYHDFQDIHVKESQRAWQLMRHHASRVISNKVNHIRPVIERLLVKTNVSLECRHAIGQTLDGAKRLELWAIQLFNSWGSFPPVGIFDGTLGDIGSYNGCIDVPENPYIGHAHYCTVSYRPVVPSRERFELVVRPETKEFVQLFDNNNLNINNQLNQSTIDYQQTQNINDTKREAYKVEDMFSKLLDKAQYYHYLYHKIGTCLPRKCSPLDVKSVAKYVGIRSILMTGPVQCHSRHTEIDDNDNRNLATNTRFIQRPVKYTQKVAMIILFILTLTIVLFTIYDHISDKYYPDSCKNKESKINSNSNNNNNLTPGNKKKHLHITTIVSNGHYDESNNNNNHISQVETDVVQPMMETSVDGDIYSQHQSPVIETVISTDIKQQDDIIVSKKKQPDWSLRELAKDFSIIRNWNAYFSTDTNSNDILCLYGLRSITMMWIILVHTMQYNDWSAFARAYQVELSIKSMLIQPLFNGSYLVDTFFLMSGMVASYSAWHGCKGKWDHFYKLNYMIGRYIRLTPQVFFTTLIFIVLPLVSSGPHWDNLTARTCDNCINNWWINLFHIQAFYKPEDMCNFVSWWISVDMLYQATGLFLFILLLINQRLALTTSIITVMGYTIYAISRHYSMEFPPNIFATIPQIGEVWTDFVVNFFWSPYCHSYPFILGFWIGHKLASKQFKKIPENQIKLGWFVTTICLICVSYGTYLWIIDTYQYTRFISSLYFLVSPIIWSTSMAWMICACHLGSGGWLNNFLSNGIFIVLGKSSYIIYLSHMVVIFLFFGNQTLLIEPSQTLLLYSIIGNIVLALAFGSFLYVVYESPCLRLHRRIMRTLQPSKRK